MNIGSFVHRLTGKDAFRRLRPMAWGDVDDALRIIGEHDGDDRRWAARTYSKRELEGQYVLEVKGRVAGVTGFHQDKDTHNTYWLSWTYLEKARMGVGLGRYMLEELLRILRDREARKVFLTASDYCCKRNGKIYQKAIDLYQALGFSEELSHPDYYRTGETAIFYGLRLYEFVPGAKIGTEDRNVRLKDFFKIAETRGAFAIEWEFAGEDFFTARDVERIVNKMKKSGAKSVFISFPSNMDRIHEPLEASGFRNAGRLSDYFCDGLHELHFRLNP